MQGGSKARVAYSFHHSFFGQHPERPPSPSPPPPPPKKKPHTCNCSNNGSLFILKHPEQYNEWPASPKISIFLDKNLFWFHVQRSWEPIILVWWKSLENFVDCLMHWPQQFYKNCITFFLYWGTGNTNGWCMSLEISMKISQSTMLCTLGMIQEGEQVIQNFTFMCYLGSFWRYWII